MKPNTNLRTVQASGVSDGAGFKISVKNAAHIMTILRDTLYSDKVLAVLREYSANAWDAHRMFGKSDVPIKVTIPTNVEPTLRIRDFGPGLSRDEMFNIFTQYGESTKRGTDDAVGMLGIGSKSGFAYSESFTVTSWNGGTKAIYNAVLDSSDEGQLNLLFEEPCGDETGLEIQIAVKQNDIWEFHTKAKELFQYFQPRPDINIDLPPPPATHEVLKNGFVDGGSDRWVAVMGCIPYRIDVDQLRSESGFAADTFYNVGGALFFDIGSVQVNASREELKYSDDTKAKLVQKFNDLVDEYVQRTLDEIDKENLSNWQKRLRAQVLHKMHLPTPTTAEDLFAKYVIIKDPPTTYTLQRAKNIVSSITINEEARVWIQDDRRSLRGYSLTEHDYVVKPAGGVKAAKAREDFEAKLKEFKLDGISVENISTRPWTQPVVSRGNGRTVNVKHRVRTFKLDETKSHFHRPYSNAWLPEEEREATDEDVYVILENFKVDYGFYYMYEQDRRLIKLFGGTMPMVCGYKSTPNKPVHSAQGTEYRKWREKFHKSLDTDENRRLVTLRAWSRICSSGYISGMGYGEGLTEKCVNALAAKLGEGHNIVCFLTRAVAAKKELDSKDVDNDVINWLVGTLNIRNCDSDVQKELEALCNPYPMLTMVDGGIRRLWATKEPNASMVEYIKLVDNNVKNEEK